MSWKNGNEQFGWVTKVLHGVIALLFISQFYLVYRRWSFPEGHPDKLNYIMLHKSIGVALLFLGIFFVINHFIGKRPSWPADMPKWERILAKFTHTGLLFVMVVMPLNGYLMASYSGYGVKFFGYAVPVFVQTNEELAGTLHSFHQFWSYCIIGLVALHVLGALKHHFISKDNILKKMF